MVGTNPTQQRPSFELDLPGSDSIRIAWFHQPNSYDCGPCALLHCIQYFGYGDFVAGKPTSKGVENVRESVNELRLAADIGLSALGLEEWFSDEDMARYLVQVGLDFEAVNSRDRLDILLRSMHEGQRALICCHRSHFQVVASSGEADNFHNLNSFERQPISLDANGLTQLALDTLGEVGRISAFSRRGDGWLAKF